ncbi:thioesterase domain-containing protein [Shewanella intestini]|uniref:Thioesterase n=1 Tax=Shewanella intestini TaxID=2017544 RepID=A0ABS5I471_9GAMM|nr:MULTISPECIES: thioesterase domain-containing protein [Shewanella]MBR9728105.1 thioesterase [Shewanella intestini]MRG36576.1 thioesterase [Shewanella sp. XMDDZSB0408]
MAAQLLQQLQQTWYDTIPLSQFMQVKPISFIDKQLCVTAPLSPNINLHQTMFAGSIYTLMTLTGWGLVWLTLQKKNIIGDIVLADASIKYHQPVSEDAIAKVSWPLDTQVDALGRGKRIRVNLNVELICKGKVCVSFTGRYVCLPKAS